MFNEFYNEPFFCNLPKISLSPNSYLNESKSKHLIHLKKNNKKTTTKTSDSSNKTKTSKSKKTTKETTTTKKKNNKTLTLLGIEKIEASAFAAVILMCLLISSDRPLFGLGQLLVSRLIYMPCLHMLKSGRAHYNCRHLALSKGEQQVGGAIAKKNGRNAKREKKRTSRCFVIV